MVIQLSPVAFEIIEYAIQPIVHSAYKLTHRRERDQIKKKTLNKNIEWNKGRKKWNSLILLYVKFKPFPPSAIGFVRILIRFECGTIEIHIVATCFCHKRRLAFLFARAFELWVRFCLRTHKNQQIAYRFCTSQLLYRNTAEKKQFSSVEKTQNKSACLCAGENASRLFHEYIL